MSYEIILTEVFKKEAKKLLKKYSSLTKELIELEKELQENPTKGVPLGNDIYKIRIAIASKNKGKSGGARIISCVKVIDKNVYLITIYSKGEKDNITEFEIQEILKSEGVI
jgi:mRNA-degrading endonuclease RelE of RelBE toxin-antitoxin system